MSTQSLNVNQGSQVCLLAYPSIQVLDVSSSKVDSELELEGLAHLHHPSISTNSASMCWQPSSMLMEFLDALARLHHYKLSERTLTTVHYTYRILGCTGMPIWSLNVNQDSQVCLIVYPVIWVLDVAGLKVEPERLAYLHCHKLGECTSTTVHHILPVCLWNFWMHWHVYTVTQCPSGFSGASPSLPNHPSPWYG